MTRGCRSRGLDGAVIDEPVIRPANGAMEPPHVVGAMAQRLLKRCFTLRRASVRNRISRWSSVDWQLRPGPSGAALVHWSAASPRKRGTSVWLWPGTSQTMLFFRFVSSRKAPATSQEKVNVGRISLGRAFEIGP